jgi:hypothetical protein
VHCVLELWIIDLWCMPHSNQDTQVSIESYHGALKHWFSLKTKGLKRHQIDWLVWKLTTITTWHYLHTSQMKKRGFIKNKVVKHIVKTNVEKATILIPFMHVSQLSFQTYNYRIIKSQPFANVATKWNTHLQNIQVAHVWMGAVKESLQASNIIIFMVTDVT